MSMIALTGGVKDTIQTMLGLTLNADASNAVCDITSEGQPKPVSGQIFYGIIGNSFANDSSQCRDDAYALEVIITLRADYCPADRAGSELLMKLKSGTNTGGLWARVDELAAAINMVYGVIDKAGGSFATGATGNGQAGKSWTGGNAYSLSYTANGFVQPLRFARAEYLGVKGPDWFWCESNGDPMSGVAAKLSFDFARRVQTLESQS
jgi:hypothetical protein